MGGKDWEVELEVEAEIGDSWACDQEYVLGESHKEEMIQKLQEGRKQKRKEAAEEKEKQAQEEPKKEVTVKKEDWDPEKSPKMQPAQRKVVKEPIPDDKNSYKYVVSDPLLRCKVNELSEIIKKCPGDKRLVLIDERNTSLLPNDLIIKVDPEKFYEFSSDRGV